MEIYNKLFPELQIIVHHHYNKLVLHEKLRKAKAHLASNFIRHPLPGNISFPELVKLDFRVGETKKVNYQQSGDREQLSFINIDKQNECFVFWGKNHFTMIRLDEDKINK